MKALQFPSHQSHEPPLRDRPTYNHPTELHHTPIGCGRAKQQLDKVSLTGTATWTGFIHNISQTPPHRSIKPCCKPSLAAAFVSAIPQSVTSLTLDEFLLQPAVSRRGPGASLGPLPALSYLRLEVNYASAESAMMMLNRALYGLSALTTLEVRGRVHHPTHP